MMRIMRTVGVATGIGKRNPGTFLKGLCGGLIALSRADHCPAKGQPLQESFGVFLWADRLIGWVTAAIRGYSNCWIALRFDKTGEGSGRERKATGCQRLQAA